MIGKLVDYNGREVMLESAWNDLKTMILTMNEMAELKLSLHGQDKDEYIYKVYIRDGVVATYDEGGNNTWNTDVNLVLNYYDNIFDAINYIKQNDTFGDIKLVEYSYEEMDETIIYSVETEFITLDIVEQYKGVEIWQ